MKDPVKLSDCASVGGQPSEDDLQRLADEGFRSVVNLRWDGEAHQPISPDAEGGRAASAGLEYRHMPVSVHALSAERVEDLKAALETLPGPVYVQCRAGQRAAALSLLAERESASTEAVLDEAKGIDLPDAPVREFIRGYLSKDQPRRLIKRMGSP